MRPNENENNTRRKLGSDQVSKKDDRSKLIDEDKGKGPKKKAKQKWKTVIGKMMVESKARTEDDFDHYEGLIEEIKKNKQGPSVKESVLSILKTQANLTEKVFEKQKYSAKEILVRKRRSRGVDTDTQRKRDDIEEEFIAQYNRHAELSYKITPEIQVKLDKIKQQNDAAAEKKTRVETEEEKGPGFFSKLLGATVIGQTLKANPRFYRMDPQDHLPELCRRCRRPLAQTLEARFTSIGILFAILLPIIGILLLFANREFVCVICEEVYVYGELTARPHEEFDEEFGEREKK